MTGNTFIGNSSGNANGVGVTGPMPPFKTTKCSVTARSTATLRSANAQVNNNTIIGDGSANLNLGSTYSNNKIIGKRPATPTLVTYTNNTYR